MNKFKEMAVKYDATDELARFRQQFLIPKHEGAEVYYFCGNSLGLQPVRTKEYILRELDHWAENAVEGHFRGEMPWKDYHHFFKAQMADLVGATPQEVVLMNTLTTNLHLMMVSFYRPTPTRFKILVEGGAFPSDQYAVETQAKFHGYNPDEAVVELHPRKGEFNLRPQDILDRIQELGDSLALIMIGGVNYYTGQLFDMEAITKAGHKVGAVVGFDLAHAAGNVKLNLHQWGVDFAVWCTYKYLNSGPGGPGGCFVHERHSENPDLPRFAGWWGHHEAERFLMKKGFIPMPGADAWQLSNAQILAMSAHKASLDLLSETTIEQRHNKAQNLWTFAVEMLDDIMAQHPNWLQIITPLAANEHGCQISLLTNDQGRKLFDYLSEKGVITDWREPNVIRLAPVPLYNSFNDVYQFGYHLKQAIEATLAAHN
jgi:kynureninase